MKINKIVNKSIEIYKLLCNYYGYIAFIVMMVLLIVGLLKGIVINSVFMFDYELSVIGIVFYIGSNTCIIGLSHWIINKKLKGNWLCILWVFPLMIQIMNLIKVILF